MEKDTSGGAVTMIAQLALEKALSLSSKAQFLQNVSPIVLLTTKLLVGHSEFVT